MTSETILWLVGIGWAFSVTIGVVKLWIEIKALQNSTHQVQYINPLSELSTLTEEEKNKLQEDPFGNIM